MKQINIGDTLRIIREDENSIDHNCSGPVVNIQKLQNDIIAYTLLINILRPNSDYKTQTHSQVREGEYELVEDNSSLIDLENVEFEK